MIGASSRTRIAVFAAGGAAIAAFAVAVVPTAHADDESWGAIAVSPDGKSVGVATNMPNEYQANTHATSDCHQDNAACNVLITFKYPDCGAVVKNGDQYFGDSGATEQEAEQNAQNQSPGSTVLRSACNNAPGSSSTPTTASSTPTTTTTTPAGG
ncbi:hypothetical protein MFM001_38390 [Mycobacterium sp. MFM001]|nr:hypothetical protein MFM001_38390 [Mycobacterium sp. MFM001]